MQQMVSHMLLGKHESCLIKASKGKENFKRSVTDTLANNTWDCSCVFNSDNIKKGRKKRREKHFFLSEVGSRMI